MDIPCIITPCDDQGRTHDSNNNPLGPVMWIDTIEWTALLSQTEITRFTDAPYKVPHYTAKPFEVAILTRSREYNER